MATEGVVVRISRKLDKLGMGKAGHFRLGDVESFQSVYLGMCVMDSQEVHQQRRE
jgi:hypothetical protein